MTRRKERGARRNARAGFTLMEVTLAAVVVGVALMAAFSALSSAAVVKAMHDDHPATAFVLATEIHCLALEVERGVWDGTPATNGAQVLVLEDLAGATFSPPINARRAVRTDLSDWKQEVALTQVALDDPSRASTVDDGAAVLWRMDVTIKRLDVIRGQFTWWIHP